MRSFGVNRLMPGYHEIKDTASLHGRGSLSDTGVLFEMEFQAKIAGRQGLMACQPDQSPMVTQKLAAKFGLNATGICENNLASSELGKKNADKRLRAVK